MKMTITRQHDGSDRPVAAMALTLGMVMISALVAAPAVRAETYRVLYNFTGGADGGFPMYGSLVQDEAGNLYGTTSGGGTSNCGTVFKVAPSTATETVLYSFTCGADGGYPYAGLTLSGDTLYGTTAYGGSHNAGVVFQLNAKTGTEEVLYTFTGGEDGGTPIAGVILHAGVLYGTASQGGLFDLGVVYKVDISTKAETVMHWFVGTDGENPVANLTLGNNGEILYGTATGQTSSDVGSVFSLNITTDQYRVLYKFSETDGAFPSGADPSGTLALDPAGNLYGTTEYGGASNNGTVYELDPQNGTETVLFSFPPGTDGGTYGLGGAFPFGGVIRSASGELIGTTSASFDGAGNVFALDNTNELVVYTFDGVEGVRPFAGVLMDSKGNLFGTTNNGGTSYGIGAGYGVVWEIER